MNTTRKTALATSSAARRRPSGVLDVLVNNAGVSLMDSDGMPGVVPVDTIRRTLEVNFYGALRTTQAFLPLVRKAPADRIVNVSSAIGSITELTAPDSTIMNWPVFAYASSKTMLNSLTGWLGAELTGTPVKVNSVCPGFNASDVNGHTGTQPPSEGAKVIVAAATLGADGPTGSFFDADGTVDW